MFFQSSLISSQHLLAHYYLDLAVVADVVLEVLFLLLPFLSGWSIDDSFTDVVLFS